MQGAAGVSLRPPEADVEAGTAGVSFLLWMCFYPPPSPQHLQINSGKVIMHGLCSPRGRKERQEVAGAVLRFPQSIASWQAPTF